MITKWDNGTPVITNDDKTRYDQLKSTLFHFLTEFKRIEPFWGSWSFRPFWPLATILAVSVGWPQIRGRSLAFDSAPSCLSSGMYYMRTSKSSIQTNRSILFRCHWAFLWVFCTRIKGHFKQESEGVYEFQWIDLDWRRKSSSIYFCK